jgi:hypothetical protein
MPQNQKLYYPAYNWNTPTASTTQWITPTVNWGSYNAATNYTIPTNYYPQITQNGYYWPQQYNTAPSTITTDQIWQIWVDQTSTYTPRIETPEELAARRRRREEYEREQRAARVRARMLLGEFLSEEQKAELEKDGRFHVTGSRGRRYCIRTSGQSGNVDLLRADGTVQATLCCHPREALPNEDAWLMQMIELRHNEDHFLRTANVHRGSLGHLVAA